MRVPVSILLTLATLSCVPDYADVPTKMVGVGYNPEEIGPAPTPYGGVVEYSWVNFAGGGLSLALMGLGSFDEVGPALVGYAPPYAAVYGFSYVFDTRLDAADSLGGVTSVPPDSEDTCYTTFDATGPIGSFKTVDVGSWMKFATEDGTGGVTLDRLPAEYPGNPQDLFIYYSVIDYWAAQPVYGLVPGESGDPADMERVLVRTRNFPFGEEVTFSFPGGLAGAEAPVASLPRPSASAQNGNTSLYLPGAPGGVRLSWNGPRYDAYGHPLADAGTQASCLAFAALPDAPVTAADCDGADVPADSAGIQGQMYTGPWDAEDGTVSFEWTPGSGTGDEYVSLAIRFLGPVDMNDPNLLERVVSVESSRPVENAWDDLQSGAQASIPPEREPGLGRRAPTACEDPSHSEWVFDDSYLTADGDLVPTMRGDPFNNVAEVTCRLKDDGSFALTKQMVAEAQAYAQRRGAQGAVFYFARSTDTPAQVPPAKDQYNQRLDISPIKLTSRAVDIGRFWYEEGTE